MEINWIFSDSTAKKETKALIDREFELRSLLSKIFLKDSFLSSCDEFDSFSFNFHPETGKLTVSKKTPEPYYAKIRSLLKRHPVIYDDAF